MAETLIVEVRSQLGKHHNRQLRRSGRVPAVLYGHGLENICLAVPAEQIEAALRHGTRMVSLSGAVEESALIRDLQWDTWGSHVMHVDFTRISADETVEVEIGVELRGEAPGVREGGVIEQEIHEVQIECPAGSIPEKLQVNINHLNLGESITVADLELPPRLRVLDDPELLVVRCVQPVEVPEEEAVEAAPGEPEIIGEKHEEEEEASE
jgi:large subunit ribosomal protein L25